MRRSFILLVILLIIPLSFAFLGITPKQRAQTALEVHWWGKAFKGACPSSTYADSGTPIYVYVSASSNGPWSHKRTDYVGDNGDYDVHFYQETSKPWVEFCTVRDSIADSLWLKNDDCNVVRFHIKEDAVKNQDICRGY